jgi:hypothetical protein
VRASLKTSFELDLIELSLLFVEAKGVTRRVLGSVVEQHNVCAAPTSLVDLRTYITNANMSKTQQPPAQRPYYHEDIDFTALAAEDADFAALLRQNDGRIDWQDPTAIQ